MQHFDIARRPDPMPSAVRRLLSLPAGAFYCLAASALAENLNAGHQPWVIASWDGAGLLLRCIIALWVLGDARRRDHPLPYDAGTFLFFAWPVLGPVYLFSTRGWRAFGVPAGFLLIYLGAVLLGTLPHLLSAVPAPSP